MQTYYNKEKTYNTLGILLTMLFIFQGWELIFSPVQIAVIILIRMFFLKKEEILESFSLLTLLYIGYLFEYHYIIIYYFEYILLLFFIVFLVYNIYVSSSTKKLTKPTIALFGVVMLLSINIYNNNNRLFKDPQLHNHMVWCVKYRRRILFGDVEEYLKQILLKIASDNRFEIVEMETNKEHIHILVECSPQHQIPNMIKALKGVSARLLFQKRPDIKKHLWGGHLWNPSYFVATESENTEEQIRKYIQNQKVM